jgi:NodT family efflux transporter outer membrane factor (OMF) lipoprotein
MNVLRLAACGGFSLLLAACATQAPPASVPAAVPAQWYAPLPASASGEGNDATSLPHNGALTDLSQWWQRHGDPSLVQLIEAAQLVSPTISASRTRIEQARATRVAAGAALLPGVDGALSVTRSSTQPPLPMASVVQGGLQASWELDLFGARRDLRDAAEARLEGAQAGWHDARVSVAAEVANQYYGLRACRRLLAIVRTDAASRDKTAQLTQQSADAGFQAPATAALARASAAEGSSRVIQQRQQCDLAVKALVTLTALDEPALRQKIDESPAMLAPAAIALAALPATILAQRPDVFNAGREVAAASAETGNAQAQRYPRLSLAGSIGAASFRAGGVTTSLDTWSIGPLSLTLPVFDAGTRAANVDAARARYDEAVARYQASIRQAVGEVEQALVNLQASFDRGDDVQVAAEGFRVSFESTENRFKAGFASLLELEDTRRTLLAAETALVTLQRDRALAWIALYRAAGGGWPGPGAVEQTASGPR